MFTKAQQPSTPRLSIAQLRILRLAFGTGLSFWFSQVIGGSLSFIAPVFTLLILALPIPAPKPKIAVVLPLVLFCALSAALLLLPTLLNQPLVGILLVVLALFWSFYFTAKGGSAIVGTLATVAIAVVTAIGSVNIDALMALINPLCIAAFFGLVFVYVGHACLPDSMAAAPVASTPKQAHTPQAPDLADARWSAFRSLLIVLPVVFWFLLSAASTAYVPVMIKVASMGQQAAADATKSAGKSLILSTIIGGAGAIIGWQVLSIAPTLPIYVLLVALAGLLMGVKIFQGPAMHPQAATWSYGYLTMLVILAPAVMDTGDGIKFWERLVMFGGTTVYAVIAVYVVDAFRPRRA